MTDTDLLILIKGSTAFKAMADAGNDSGIADTINASRVPTPLTSASLQAACPKTFVALAARPTGIQDLNVIGTSIQSGDAIAIGAWAAAFHVMTIMPDDEYAAVQSLVAAAMPADTVNHDQVSRVLNAIRPVVDGSPRGLPITWTG